MKTLIVDEMAKGEERAREMKTEILKFKSVDKWMRKHAMGEDKERKEEVNLAKTDTK